MRLNYEIRNDKILIQNNFLLFLLQFVPLILLLRLFIADLVIILILYRYVTYTHKFVKNIKKSPIRYESIEWYFTMLASFNIFIEIFYISIPLIFNGFLFLPILNSFFTIILLYGTFYLQPIYTLLAYLINFVLILSINIYKIYKVKENASWLYVKSIVHMCVSYCLGFQNVFLKCKKSKWRKIFFFTTFYFFHYYIILFI